MSSANEIQFPRGPVTVVVPQAAGSVADRLTRTFTPALSRALGQPVLIENRPGSQGLVGSQHVATQTAKDGHTMLMTSLNNIASFSIIVKDRGFDPLKDLTPVLGFAETRLLFGTAPTQPWKSFDELIAYMKTHPDTLHFGASSSSNRITTELLLRARGVRAAYNPYDAAQVYQQSVADGESHMGLMPERSSIKWGDQIRYMAQTGGQRSVAFPNVPTFSELGLPQIKGVVYMLSVRSGAPKAAVETLNAAITRALKEPEIVATFDEDSLEILRQTPETAQKNLLTHTQYLADLSRELGISPQ